MIEINELSFRYTPKSKFVLNKLSFILSDAEVLCILGQNGVGKTTLLRCITGEIRNYIGSILIRGKEAKDYSVKDLAHELAIVASNNPVYQNLCVADYLLTGLSTRLTTLVGPRKKHYDEAYVALEDLGKGDLFNRSISHLSSGELQIVKMARAIVQNPSIILFDEPTTNLDVKNQLLVLDRIALLSEKGYTVITTSHNPGQAIELGGQVLMCFPDHTYLYAAERDVMTAENLKKLYNLKAAVDVNQNRRYTIFTNQQGKHSLFY